jgi:hypothetical protein
MKEGLSANTVRNAKNEPLQACAPQRRPARSRDDQPTLARR